MDIYRSGTGAINGTIQNYDQRPYINGLLNYKNPIVVAYKDVYMSKASVVVDDGTKVFLD